MNSIGRQFLSLCGHGHIWLDLSGKRSKDRRKD